MKRILASFILIATVGKGFSQQVTKSTVTIDKQPQAGQTVRFQETESVVEDAIKSIIKKNDGRVKTSKGYIIGRKVKMSELSDQKLDVYFKVESEGRRKNQISIVTMAIEQPDGKFASDSSNNELQQRGTVFLTGFQQRVLLYKKDTEIAELQAKLKKLNKTLASDHQDHLKNLDKKTKQMKEIESRLSELTGGN